MSRPSLNLKNPAKAALLAWMVPGLGHYYQGRHGKACLYAICILGLYFTGLALGDWRVVYWTWINPLRDPENFRISYVGQFFVGLAALPGLIQATLGHLGFRGPILWGFLAEPPPNEVFGLHPRLGKLVEVGWIYTVIAGLLNILAIYDAYEGPALVDEPESSAAASTTLDRLQPEGAAA